MNQEEQILVDQEIEKMFEKQAIQLVQPSKDWFLSTLFLVTKRHRISSSDQFEKVESVHPIRTLQNGKSISFERNSPEERLYVQDRFEGRLFCSSPSFRLPEIYQVQVERESLSVSTPLLWPKFSSKGIHKTNKELNFRHAEIEYEADIYRQCFDNGINKKGTNSSEGYFDISSSNIGVFGQQKQICIASIPDFTVSSCGDKFERNECIASPRKKAQNYFTMSKHSKRGISFYKGVDTGVRSSIFHSHCSVSGTSSISSNSKTIDIRSCNYKKFRFSYSFDRGSKKRTVMVGGKTYN